MALEGENGVSIDPESLKEINKLLEGVGDASSKSSKDVDKLAFALSKAEAQAVTPVWKQQKSQMLSLGKVVQKTGLKYLEYAKMVKQAADYAAEHTLAASRSMQGLQLSVDGAADAFGGLYTNAELAESANRAYRKGAVSNGDEFATLARGAAATAPSSGKGELAALNDIVDAYAAHDVGALESAGISFDMAEANETYAASIGKTVNELGSLDKERASERAAMNEMNRLYGDGATHLEGYAAGYTSIGVTLENVQAKLWGFKGTIGGLREDMRGFSDAQISAVNNLPRDTYEDRQSFNRKLKGTGYDYESVVNIVDDAAGVDRGGKVSLQVDGDDRKKREARAESLAREAEKHRKKERDHVEALAEEDAIAAMKLEADELSHQVDLYVAAGEQQEVIDNQRLITLDKLVEIARREGDINDLREARQKIAVIEAKPPPEEAEPPKKSGRRGPSKAERVRAAGEGRVQELEQEAEVAERLAAIHGRTAEERIVLEEKHREAALASIQLERDVLDATKAQNSVERERLETRRAELNHEETVIKLEAQADAQSHINELISDAVALTTQRAQLEDAQANRVTEVEQLELQSRAQQIQAESELEALGTNRALERIQIQSDAAAEAHQIKLRQIELETQARLRDLDAKERALRAETPKGDLAKAQHSDAIKQVLHEKQLARTKQEMDFQQAADTEKTRLAQVDNERLQTTLAKVGEWTDALSQIASSVMSFTQQMMQYAWEAQDADQARHVETLEAKGQAQTDALDRDIEAAEGNDVLQAKLRKKKAKIQRSTQRAVEDSEKKHQEKRKRAEMRFAGIQLLIDAAVQVGKAASSYPNVPSMVAHGIAAALNTAMGVALLSGQVPRGGGASVSGGGDASVPEPVEHETSEASSVPGSLTGDRPAEKSNSLAAGNKNKKDQGVAFNGSVTINALGTIDQAAAEQIGLALGTASYGREGAA